MKTIHIDQASAAQLRFYAETVLGLEIPKLANAGQVRAKIEAAAPGTIAISVEGDAPESPAQAAAVERSAVARAHMPKPQEKIEDVRSRVHGLSAKQAAAHHHDPKIGIYMQVGNEKGGERDVPVNVNGVQFLIRRGEWVEVPYRVFEALQVAVQTMFEPVPDEQGRTVATPRDVFSYNFSTRNAPSEAEIAEWRARTEGVELA